MSLKRDTIYNLGGAAIPLFAAAITIPYLMNSLGAERFGALSLIWALIGYFGIFDLGIGRAMTYEVSKVVGSDGHENVRRVVHAGLILTLATGCVGAMVIYFFVAPNAGAWFKVGVATTQEVRTAFQVAAFGIAPTTLNSGLRGGLEGFGKFSSSSANRALLGTAMFVLPALSCYLGRADLGTITWTLICARMLVCALGIVQLRASIFGPMLFDINNVMSLLRYGVWVTISGIVSPLMAYGDRFFVSAVVGIEAVSFYAIPQEGISRLLIIPAALASALMPRMTRAAHADALRTAYHLNLRRLACVMLVVCIVVAVIAHPLLAIWMSKDFADGATVVVYILCVGLWFNAIAQLPITLLHASGRPKQVALLHLSELVVFVGLIVLLSREFGVKGAAAAWAIRVTADFFALHILAMKATAK